MSDQDQEWAEFFEEERRRDMEGAPAFAALVASTEPERQVPADGPAMPRWRGPLGVLMAASILAAVVFIGRGADSGTDVGGLDRACDAALAALQEQESEARMETPTDTLLHD